MQESTSTCASQYFSTYACCVGLYIGTVWADTGFKKYLTKILCCSSVCRTSTRVHWQSVTHLTSDRDSGSLISLSLRIRRHAYDRQQYTHGQEVSRLVQREPNANTIPQRISGSTRFILIVELSWQVEDCRFKRPKNEFQFRQRIASTSRKLKIQCWNSIYSGRTDRSSAGSAMVKLRAISST